VSYSWFCRITWCFIELNIPCEERTGVALIGIQVNSDWPHAHLTLNTHEWRQSRTLVQCTRDLQTRAEWRLVVNLFRNRYSHFTFTVESTGIGGIHEIECSTGSYLSTQLHSYFIHSSDSISVHPSISCINKSTLLINHLVICVGQSHYTQSLNIQDLF